MLTSFNRLLDADLQLKDAGLVAGSAAAQVGGSAKIHDGGDADLFGDVVVDVTAIEIGNDNERYDIVLEGSSSASFASDIEELGRLVLGANEVITGGSDVDSVVGRYAFGFYNSRAGKRYRYLRIYTVVAGTVGTGINYTAHLTLRN